MKVKIDTKEHFHLIVPQEPLFTANMAEQWRDTLISHAAMTPFNLVISLQEVTFMDSSCLSMLSQQVQKSHQDHHSVAIHIPPHSPLRSGEASEITHLDPVFTLEEAIDLVAMESLERELLDDADDALHP